MPRKVAAPVPTKAVYFVVVPGFALAELRRHGGYRVGPFVLDPDGHNIEAVCHKAE